MVYLLKKKLGQRKSSKGDFIPGEVTLILAADHLTLLYSYMRRISDLDDSVFKRFL